MQKNPTAEGKRGGKQAREHSVLIGLIEYYIETGKPVGSNTLKECGFEDLSSATIRNYFANLEKKGLLTQAHSSGGRIPTDRAFRLYGHEILETDTFLPEIGEAEESREIAAFLQESAEKLCHLTGYPVFLSAPRFDHDFVADVKLVPININRCLCVLITDFGVIKTEIIHLDQKLTTFFTKKMEGYFHFRLTGHDKPENLTTEEEQTGQRLYNEVMVRYIVGYSNFIDEELYRTGFSKLLNYPEYHDTTLLASSLALFENSHALRLMIRETMKKNTLNFWISDDLNRFTSETPDCTIIALPYAINHQPAGAIGIMGPTRLPYKKVFSLVKAMAGHISQTLTKSVYKFKITFRQPHEGTLYLQQEERKMLGQSRMTLLEDKRRKNND